MKMAHDELAMFGNQFTAVLEMSGLKQLGEGKPRTLYTMLHTAIHHRTRRTNKRSDDQSILGFTHQDSFHPPSAVEVSDKMAYKATKSLDVFNPNRGE